MHGCKVARWGAMFLVALLFPSLASARQTPRALPHGAVPFGHSSKAVCAPPSPGHASCFARGITNSSGALAVTNLPAGYGPVDLQTAYNLSTLSATQGTGQTVAIVDAYDDPNAEADLGVYRSTYGLSACTTANGCFRKVNQTGGTSPLPPFNAGWSDEISLDLDMVSAIAPNAHIVLVETNDNQLVNLAAGVNEAATLGATQISNSYGGDEGFAFSNNLNTAYNHPGTAVVASAGDSGYYGDNTDASFPASSQYVESVGGTSLTSVSPRTESVWGEAGGYVWGTGSGCSQFFPKPSWQTDPSCAKRMVSDVSAVADPFTGVAIYDSNSDIGGFAIFGGTSASSPILASFDALVGSATSSPQWPYQHLGIWNDVTTGNNVAPHTCTVAYFCNGEVGYDGPTGLGTPNGTLAVPAPPTPTITSKPTDPTTSTTASFSFSDTDATATFKCSLDASAYTACPSPKVYTGLSTGSHTFNVEAVGVGGTSAPASYTWTINTVAAPPSPTITSSPTNPTTSTSANFAFTDTDATATFKCSLDGATYATCTSPKTYTGLSVGSHTFGVEAVSAGGTSSPTTYTWSVTAPVKPPATPKITSGPHLVTSASSATFVFNDSTAGVTFQCSLDNSAYTSCSSPKTYRGLKIGLHRFKVKATNSGGTSSAATYVWLRY